MSEVTLPYIKEAFLFMEQTLSVSTESEAVDILLVYKDTLKYMLTRLYAYEGKLVDDGSAGESTNRRLSLYKQLNEQYNEITNRLLKLVEEEKTDADK